MQVLPFILAASMMDPSLPLYHIPDAKGGIEDSWSQVALERDGSCEIEVTGNGQFNRITMRGFAPGEIGYFRLTNDKYFRLTWQKIKPIEYRFRADKAGEFSKIYIPFLWHHSGGTAGVTASGEGCEVNLSFPWQRKDVRVH
jgi:hypothetical protein